jgi:hypothetical protein
MDFHKLLHRKPEEEKPAFEEIPPMKSTSEVPAKLLAQKVGRIHGSLVYFNDEMFPHLSGSKVDLAKQFCVFADRAGAWGDGKTKAYSNGRNIVLPCQLTDRDKHTWPLGEVQGAGLPTDNVWDNPNPIYYVGEARDTWGIFDKRKAEADRDFSLEVLKRGGYTSMPFMILEIDKIITESGELRDIKELQEEGKISKTIEYRDETTPYQPVVYVRLSSEVRPLFNAEKSDFVEIAKKNEMDIEAFRRRLAERAAVTLAVIHDFGVVKPTIWYDLTLDGSIVNLEKNIKPEGLSTAASDVVEAVQTICKRMPILNEKYSDEQFQAGLLLTDENLSIKSRENIELQVRDVAALFLKEYRASRKNLSESEREEMLKQFKSKEIKFTGLGIEVLGTVEFVDKPKSRGGSLNEKALEALSSETGAQESEKAAGEERPREEKKKAQK